MPFPDSEFVRQGYFSNVMEIGRGAQTIVYRADYPRVGTVAVKSAPQGAPDAAQISQRLAKEWQILQRLNHPQIVSAHRLLTDPLTREHYLVCEHVIGGSLAAYLDARGPDAPLGQDEAIGYALDICAALEELERQGVVHRDLKPSNILLDEPRPGQRVAKLADFGVAQDQQGQLTTVRTGVFFSGTPAYMAPEQASPATPLDTRADTYALGITLWELLTRRRDYKQLARAGKADPRRFNRQVSAGVAAVIARATQEDPERRYQRAADLAADLRLVRAGRRPKLAGRSKRPRPLTLAGAAAALGLLLALGLTVGFSLSAPPAAGMPESGTPSTVTPTAGDAITPSPTATSSPDLGATSVAQQTATAIALTGSREAAARAAARLAREAAEGARANPTSDTIAAAEQAALDARAAARAAREAGADTAADEAEAAGTTASEAASAARGVFVGREQAAGAAVQAARLAREAAGAARQNQTSETAAAAERAADAAAQAAQSAREAGAADAATEADNAAADARSAAADARQVVAQREAAAAQREAAASQARSAIDRATYALSLAVQSPNDLTIRGAEMARQELAEAAAQARAAGAGAVADEAEALIAQMGVTVKQLADELNAATAAAMDAASAAEAAAAAARNLRTPEAASQAERAGAAAREAAARARQAGATEPADRADRAAQAAVAAVLFVDEWRRQPGFIPELNARVEGLKFYEKGSGPLPRDQRQYSDWFLKLSARYICYELDLEYPEARAPVNFTIKSLWTQPDGSVEEWQHDASITAGWSGSLHPKCVGWEQGGNWDLGSYKVELYFNQQFIAGGSYRVQ